MQDEVNQEESEQDEVNGTKMFTSCDVDLDLQPYCVI